MNYPGAAALAKEERSEESKDRLGDEVADLTNFFKNRLINSLIGVFGGHLVDETIKGNHRQKILFIVNPKLLPVRFNFFINEFPGYSNPLLVRKLHLHRVLAVCYLNLYREILHEIFLHVAYLLKWAMHLSIS